MDVIIHQNMGKSKLYAIQYNILYGNEHYSLASYTC